MNIKTLIIDNYDSFTNNLYQYIANINKELPFVIKNDELNLSEIINLEFDNIVISPGPGHPDKLDDFGVCKEVIRNVDVPILGVCLGHQGIGSVFGAEITHAPYPVHGLEYLIQHNDDVIFRDIPREFRVIRYHSLLISQDSLPDCLDIIATSDSLIMGLKHKTKPIWGLQFHPESINTQHGYKILENFMANTHAKEKLVSNQQALKVNQQQYMDTFIQEFSLKHRKLDYLYAEQQVFMQIYKNEKQAVWLDSNHTESDMSRFSILGCINGPHSYQIEYDVDQKLLIYKKGAETSSFATTIFEFLNQQLANTKIESSELPFNFKCGFIGYFGYELYRDTLNIDSSSISEHPDAQFLFTDRAIVFDKQEKCTYLLALHDESTVNAVDLWFDTTCKQLDESLSIDVCDNIVKEEGVVNLELQRNAEQYTADINECLGYIKDGESYEICLTTQALCNKKVDAIKYYLALRSLSPAPFSAFLRFGDLNICSSSMERFLSIDKQGRVETKPIKGTLPRGKDLETDLQLIKDLRSQRKFQSENLMIVDLLRHDLGGVCEIGSIKVEKLMDVESYASVHQLVSTISGKLRKDISAIDCIKACFPGGSMVGAPKKRTIQLIDSIEKSPRGIYSGAIGYISLDGCIELNIVIRTAVITPDKLSIGVGGAIIALSDPAEEYAEAQLKLKLLNKALTYVE